jgi:hypothetical protein
MENENKRCAGLPVILINDVCLAFNVLIHNDAKEGRPNLRLLDLSENHITPTIVMNIAHKHLGTNKGLSTIAGTKGALSIFKECRRVGFQPPREDFVRALANLRFVGVEAYYGLYCNWSTAIERAVSKLESAGFEDESRQPSYQRLLCDGFRGPKWCCCHCFEMLRCCHDLQ